MTNTCADSSLAFGHCCENIAEPTDEPDMCSCEVSKAEFDDLKATVDELRASIGRTEADNNDVMSSMEEMATCMAGIVDRYSTDEPETTLEMKVPSMEPTERRVTMEPTERRVTMEPTERRTTMEPTEDRPVTARPTEAWEMYGELYTDDDLNKCGGGADRALYG